MSVPRWLLEAIARACDDEVRMEAIAREWRRRLPEMHAAAERIRAAARVTPCSCVEAESETEGVADDRCFAVSRGDGVNVDLRLSDDDVERLADALAERLAPLLARPSDTTWVTTRQAAEHVGFSIDALHRHTAAREIPLHQERPGARCYFRRDQLDAWRRGA